MAKKIIEAKRPYQREKYIAFKQSGKKLNAKISDGFTEYRDITTGEIVQDVKLDLPTVRLFTYEKKTARLLKYAGDRSKLLAGEEVELRDFVYFVVRQISAKNNEMIGRITEYTTEDRLSSMIYRYYNPEHAEPISFGARVLFSGSPETEEEAPGKKRISEASRMPYVMIPDTLIDKSGLCVDDEISITITNERGDHYTDHYHISNMGLYNLREEGLLTEEKTRRFIVPLTKFKRAVVLEYAEGELPIRNPIKFVTGKKYTEHTRKLREGEPITYEFSYKGRPTKENPKPEEKTLEVPCHRLIDEYSEVTVQISPQPYTVNNPRTWSQNFYRPVELTPEELSSPDKEIKIGTLFREPIKRSPSELLNDPDTLLIGRFDLVIETLITFRPGA